VARDRLAQGLARQGAPYRRYGPQCRGYARGTAVAPEQLRGAFAAIPGVGFPTHPPQVIRLDFGPDAASGVATTLPPVEGKPYPHFVPAVDRDGNEVSGIRLPDLTVPLATYAGWNLRHPQMGASDKLMSLMGATIPFPATRGRTSNARRRGPTWHSWGNR
jgi:hypothetical protein